MLSEAFDLAGENGSGIAPTLAPSAALYYQWNDSRPVRRIGERSENLVSGGHCFLACGFAQLLAWVNHSEQVISRDMRNIVAILPVIVEVVFMANPRGGVMDGTVALRNAVFTAYRFLGAGAGTRQ